MQRLFRLVVAAGLALPLLGPAGARAADVAVTPDRTAYRSTLTTLGGDVVRRVDVRATVDCAGPADSAAMTAVLRQGGLAVRFHFLPPCVRQVATRYATEASDPGLVAGPATLELRWSLCRGPSCSSGSRTDAVTVSVPVVPGVKLVNMDVQTAQAQLFASPPRYRCPPTWDARGTATPGRGRIVGVLTQTLAGRAVTETGIKGTVRGCTTGGGGHLGFAPKTPFRPGPAMLTLQMLGCYGEQVRDCGDVTYSPGSPIRCDPPAVCFTTPPVARTVTIHGR